MIIGNNQKGTVRDNINHLKGEKNDNDYKPVGSRFRHDEVELPPIKDAVDLSKIDPDDRGMDDESNWKDFY